MPTTDSGGVFGKIVTLRDVRLAVVSFLLNWVPTYIGQMEQQAQLPPGTIPMPPDPVLSYRAGLDFNTWEAAWSPIYIAIVKPIGAPEIVSGAGEYIQAFDVNVGCNFQMTNEADSLGTFEEDSAIQYADMLGMAACAAMVQNGGLGTWPDGSFVSSRTRLTQYPTSFFPFPDAERTRRVVRSQFSVTVYVDNVLSESDGPSTPVSNPYASQGSWPYVTSTPGITVSAVPIGSVPTIDDELEPSPSVQVGPYTFPG